MIKQACSWVQRCSWVKAKELDIYEDIVNEGKKAIQYLSYGKPIICVAKGDCQELLKECGGVIFADKDLSSIRSAYQKIISLSDEEKEIMGKANKKYYDEHLTNDVLIKKIEDVLSSSIKN